jgi:hypothetical protein
LGDRVHNQRMRIALLRKGLVDNAILQDALAEHQRYVRALESHASGLEHNVEILTQSLAVADAKYQAVFSQRTPLSRGIYNRFRRLLAKRG